VHGPTARNTAIQYRSIPVLFMRVAARCHSGNAGLFIGQRVSQVLDHQIGEIGEQSVYPRLTDEDIQ
jgi:hypothetical protein